MLYPELAELIKLKSTVQHAIAGARYQHYNRTQGDYTSILHGLGVEFETIRPYVVGDDVRYIDWRTTARIGKPQVKTFRAECDRNVLIVVDANAYMRFGTQGTFKSIQAARAAAIMSWVSLLQQDRVGSLVFGDIPSGIQFFKTSKSHNSILRMLRLLCSKEINQHSPVPMSQALTNLKSIVKPQSVLIIIGDFSMEPLDDLQKSLVGLRKICNLMLFSVYDPADTIIPDTGTLICSNDKDQTIIYTANGKSRQIYQKLWNDHKNGLEKLTKKLQIPMVWLETTMDPVRRIWMG